jgi:hypothetical protein
MTSGFGSISSIQMARSSCGMLGADALADLGGVRCSCAEHELRALIDRRRRIEQVLEPLLVRDAANEDHVRRCVVDAVPLEHVGAVVGPILRCVDAVVDDADPLRLDRRVAGEDVVAHRAGDRDDRVRILECGALAERGQLIAAAELLLLPRAATARGCASSRRAGCRS